MLALTFQIFGIIVWVFLTLMVFFASFTLISDPKLRTSSGVIGLVVSTLSGSGLMALALTHG